MDCKDLVIDGLGRVEESMQMTLDGLNAGQLAYRPAEHANSIAWLAWHLTRIEDDHVSDMAGQPQAWIAAGWHARFDRPANPDDTGFGHGPADVAEHSAREPAGPARLLRGRAPALGRVSQWPELPGHGSRDRHRTGIRR